MVKARDEVRGRRFGGRWVFFALVVMTVAGVVMGVFPLLFPTPATTGDVVAAAERLREKHMPEGEDAWPRYERVIAENEWLFGEWDETNGWDLAPQRVLDRLASNEWGHPPHAEALELAKRLPGLLEGVEWATAAPACMAPMEASDRGSINRVRTAAAVPIRTLVRTLSHLMRIHAAAGDWEGVERVLRVEFAALRHVGLQGTPGSLSWEGNVGHQTCMSLRRALLESPPPGDVCMRLASIVEERLSPRLTVAAAIEAERLAQQARLARYFDVAGRPLTWRLRRSAQRVGISRVMDPPTIGDRLINISALWQPGWPETMRGLEAMLKEAEAALEGEFPLPWPRPARAMAGRDWPLRAGTAHQMHVSLGNMIWARESARVGTVAFLTILAFKDEHGRWPETLEEAVPEEFCVLVCTGERLGYVVSAAGWEDEADGTKRVPFRLTARGFPSWFGGDGIEMVVGYPMEAGGEKVEVGSE